MRRVGVAHDHLPLDSDALGGRVPLLILGRVRAVELLDSRVVDLAPEGPVHGHEVGQVAVRGQLDASVGECEVLESKLAGAVVNIGARVVATARPGEVLVSSTVKDLVAGSGIRFRDWGLVELKGLPGEWRLYAAET